MLVSKRHVHTFCLVLFSALAMTSARAGADDAQQLKQAVAQTQAGLDAATSAAAHTDCAQAASNRPAQPLAGTASSGPADRSALVAELTAIARAYVRHLSHPVDVYHYLHRENADVPLKGRIRVNPAWLKSYPIESSHLFWDPTQTVTGMHVNGLYAAIDPGSSKWFGGEHWLLIRFRLKEGMSYLDVDQLREEGKDGLSDELKRRLATLGCKAENLQSLLIHSLGPECRGLADDIVGRLKVDAISYPYQSRGYATCDVRRETAFILLEGAARTAQAQLFYKEMPDDLKLHQERVAIEALFNMDRGLGNGELDLPPPGLWPKLDDQPEGDMAAWIRRNLMYCDYPPDGIPPAPGEQPSLLTTPVAPSRPPAPASR